MKHERQGRASLGGARPGVPSAAVEVLVRRITYGCRRAELQRARGMGFSAYLEEQLAPASIDDSALEARLAGFSTLELSPKQIFDAFWTMGSVGGMPPGTVPFQELKGASVLRATYSKRQLFERLVELWSDHFNIDHRKGWVWAMKTEDDRDVIRRYAMTSFPQLLHATARSGAMLYYLDNWTNLASGPQENYARELLEVHTLGAGGGFTEEDVREVAKCFTGWTLNLDINAEEFLRFDYEPRAHSLQSARVLGTKISRFRNQRAGSDVLDLLAAHPSTARHVARKLVGWFLSGDEPAAVVDRVAGTYMATGGDIPAMLRTLLTEQHLDPAGGLVQPKFRRPFHFAVSLLRALEAEVSDPDGVVYSLATLGHSPFDWPTPDGYPDDVQAWSGGLRQRWSLAARVTAGALPGVSYDVASLHGRVGGTQVSGLAQRMNEELFGEALGAEDLDALQEFLNTNAPILGVEWVDALGLAASAPGFQWY